MGDPLLLLVSGASGVGKSTARVYASRQLGPEFEHAELAHFGPIPAAPTVAWRQETVEVAARRAVELAREGRHLLLAGDPVPAGEALAVPSSADLDVAVCLLDADEASQNARLDARDDPPEIRHLNLSFAAWLRAHATDPGYVPEAITTDAWPQMQWDRFLGTAAVAAGIVDRWTMTVIDTSTQTPAQVGAAVGNWCVDAVAGHAPVFRAGWYR